MKNYETLLISLKGLLKDIYDGKFKDCVNYESKRKKTNLDKIKNDHRYKSSKKLIYYLYIKKEYGIKYMIKYLNLPISYSVLRRVLIDIFNIKLRSDKILTNHIRKIRREKALYEQKNKIGWASQECINKVKIKTSTSRGIQGFYFNKSLIKYVWLRSSWEYIYAKWLDENNFIWDIEAKTYLLSNNITYRPDFFIFEDNIIKKIIEVKGFWKDKTYKYEELKKMMIYNDIEFLLITDIRPYSLNLKKDINEWKLIRKLK